MRIAIIDHSFHVKTRSTLFLPRLLGECGAVDVLWCDRWEGGSGVDIDRMIAERFDCVVFCQQLYEPEELARLAQASRIVLVPMFDQYAGWKQTQWRRYRPWPFVSFSLELHRRLVRAGCPSLPVRYFPLIPATSAAARTRTVAEGLTGIFWQRERRIDWPLVSRVIGRLPVTKLYVRSLADPGQQAAPIPDADRARFGIVDLPWFDHPDDYLALLDEVDFFVAPRKYEGIGMTFLEALARGKTVIAADRPTMNEYISQGDNGFLFSTRFPRPIPSLGDPARLAAAIARRNHIFAEEWREGERLIVELVRTGTVPRTAGPTTTSRSRLASALRIFTG
jgi:hypothetical protein